MNVKFTKAVDDINPYLSRCVALVAPIQYGSGIKIKIIEAMALGVPVITNQLGIEGLAVRNGIEIIVCNEPNEYVQAVAAFKKL